MISNVINATALTDVEGVTTALTAVGLDTTVQDMLWILDELAFAHDDDRDEIKVRRAHEGGVIILRHDGNTFTAHNPGGHILCIVTVEATP